MKAITIRPPWSWVIAETAALAALGIPPKVENRPRRVAEKHIGHDVAIHAGWTWCKLGERDPRVRRAWAQFAAAIDYHKPHPLLAAVGDLRTGFVGALSPGLWIDQGAVVAVATLDGCHPAELVAHGPYGTCCAPWGEREQGGRPAQHLVLSNVRRLADPVPAKGYRWVPWDLPDDVAAKVQAQLPAGVTR